MVVTVLRYWATAINNNYLLLSKKMQNATSKELILINQNEIIRLRKGVIPNLSQNKLIISKLVIMRLHRQYTLK